MAPRGIGAFYGMPLVGLFLAKYDPRKFLASGLLIAAVTLWSFSRLDLNAGYWDFFWPQFIQGISLALLFVPLTTITMSPIPKEEMGNATSLFNLMRNLGGSFGIATTTTLIVRHQQQHTNVLVAHINPYNAQAMARLHGLQSTLGGDPVLAMRRAYAVLNGMVLRQAAILSYIDVFLILCCVFLAIFPLI